MKISTCELSQILKVKGLLTTKVEGCGKNSRYANVPRSQQAIKKTLKTIKPLKREKIVSVSSTI